MKTLRHLSFALFCGLGTPLALAYGGPELQEDCLAAETLLTGQKSTDIFHSVKSSRCLTYLEGFRDGYGIADRLAAKVGVGINAFCPPPADADRIRLVRAVLAYLDRQPPLPRTDPPPASAIVAAAFSKAFACQEEAPPAK